MHPNFGIKYRRKQAVRQLGSCQLAQSFASKRKDKFWVHVKQVKCRPSHPSLLVDGVNGKTEVANIFASKFSALLNKHSSSSRNSLLATIQSSLTSPHIFSVTVTEDQVSAAISQLKPHKSDASSVTSEHIKFASPVIITPLSLFFTAVLRHGHMPQDSVIVPVPKAKKDPSKSLNYRPITLSSSFSKILERLILSITSPSLPQVLYNLVSKLEVQQLYVQRLSRISYLVIRTTALRYLAVFWMPVRLLIL